MDWSDSQTRFAFFFFLLFAWCLLRLRHAYAYALQAWPGKGEPDEPMLIVLPTIVMFGAISVLQNGVDALLPLILPCTRLPLYLGTGFALLANWTGLRELTSASIQDNVAYAQIFLYTVQGFFSLLLVIRLRHYAYQRIHRSKSGPPNPPH